MRLSKITKTNIGAIIILSGTSAPTGWLLCNGAEISRVDYARLFSEIGVLYGVGDGSTTFNLPDLRGEFVRGYDPDNVVDFGRGSIGSLQQSQVGLHAHPTGSIELGTVGISHPHGNTNAAPASLGPGNAHTFPRVVPSPVLAGVGADFTSPSILRSPHTTPGPSVTSSFATAPHPHTASVGTDPAAHSHPSPEFTGSLGSRGGVYTPGPNSWEPAPGATEVRPRNCALNYIVKV